MKNIFITVGGDDFNIIKSKTNDNKSYYILSEKNKKLLNFKTELTIKDEVVNLMKEFDNRIINNQVKRVDINCG